MTFAARACLLPSLAVLAGCAGAEQPPSVPIRPPGPLAPLYHESWSTPVDFDALRESWGARDDFVFRCEANDGLGEIRDAVADSDWSAVERLADPWLRGCPVEARVHLFRAFALDQLGRPEEAKPHVLWFKHIVDCVLASGDGKTPQTAWITISVAEEYAVLDALGLEKVSQSLERDPMVDRMVVRSEDGEQLTVYFNPVAHFARLKKMFGETP